MHEIRVLLSDQCPSVASQYHVSVFGGGAVPLSLIRQETLFDFSTYSVCHRLFFFFFVQRRDIKL